MITVKRDNDSVVIMISTDLANDCGGLKTALIPFGWKCESVYTADLLQRYIYRLILYAISSTRRDYYNLGWNDAKSKRKRKENFDGDL